MRSNSISISLKHEQVCTVNIIRSGFHGRILMSHDRSSLRRTRKKTEGKAFEKILGRSTSCVLCEEYKKKTAVRNLFKNQESSRLRTAVRVSVKV